MFYGAIVWDPWLIVGQIVCFQCLYYLTLGFFLSILVGSHVSRMSLVYFFDYSTLTASTVTGWCNIASFLLSAIAGIGSLEGHSYAIESFQYSIGWSIHMQSFDIGGRLWKFCPWDQKHVHHPFAKTITVSDRHLHF